MWGISIKCRVFLREMVKSIFNIREGYANYLLNPRPDHGSAGGCGSEVPAGSGKLQEGQGSKQVGAASSRRGLGSWQRAIGGRQRPTGARIRVQGYQ